MSGRPVSRPAWKWIGPIPTAPGPARGTTMCCNSSKGLCKFCLFSWLLLTNDAMKCTFGVKRFQISISTETLNISNIQQPEERQLLCSCGVLTSRINGSSNHDHIVQL